MLGIVHGILVVGVISLLLKAAAYGEHSEFGWHLLESEATIEHCQRVLNEGKMIAVQSNGNEGYTIALYFGGNLYQLEVKFGLQYTGCKAYRISHANRQSQRR